MKQINFPEPKSIDKVSDVPTPGGHYKFAFIGELYNGINEVEAVNKMVKLTFRFAGKTFKSKGYIERIDHPTSATLVDMIIIEPWR